MIGPKNTRFDADTVRCSREAVRATLKRAAPAFLLLLLSPLVAEYLSGSMGMALMPLLPLFMLLYGGGALLIREVARRFGRGYSTMLLLALSYGILEEGIWDQSLFNPNFNGMHLLDYGFVPAVGLALPWTLYVLAIHVVWSVLVPVAIAEALSGRGTEPWLKIPGLLLSGVAYLMGGGIILYFSMHMQHFIASAAQIGASAVAAVICIALAFFVPVRPAAVRNVSLPPLIVAVLGLVITTAFVLTYAQGSKLAPWFVVLGVMAVLTLGCLWWGFCAGSGKNGSGLHHVAMAGGALQTYCWLGFVTEPVLHPGSTILPHAILVVVMLSLLGLAVRKTLSQVR